MSPDSRESRPQMPPPGETRAVPTGSQLTSLHGPLSGLNEAPIVSSWICSPLRLHCGYLIPPVATISGDRCLFVAPIERRLRAKAILSIEVVVLPRTLS